MKSKTLRKTRKHPTLRRTASETYMINKKYIGAESPLYDGSQSSLARALQWHHMMLESSDARLALTEFLNECGMDQYANNIAKIVDSDLPLTECWLARIHLDQMTLPQQYIDRIISVTIEIVDRAVSVTTDSIEKKTVLQALSDRINDLITEIEQMLDKQSSVSQIIDMISSKSTPEKYIKKIIEYYAPVVAELTAAVKKTDQQIIEGYRLLSVEQLNQRLEYFVDLITQLENYSNVPQSARKTAKVQKVRATRTISPLKKVAKLKYLRQCETSGISSISPVKIIGASELWLFNTKMSVLTRIVAAKNRTLDIRGQSVINFDPSASISKRVGRIGTSIIDRVRDVGKVELRKILDQINTSAVATNGKINNNMLIVRVV